jgi:hypothetical protein
MRRNLCNVLVGWLLVVTLGLAGCGSDSSGTQNITYLPVTVGSTWQFTNSDSTIRVETITANTNNRVTREVNSASGKSIATEVISNNASYLVSREVYDAGGNYTATKIYTPAPGMLFLPSSTTPGTNETQTVQIITLPANTNSSLSQDVTVIGFETITVPAGTFSNTMKIQTIVSGKVYLSRFALNVGMIRQDIDDIKAFELTSYNIT